MNVSCFSEQTPQKREGRGCGSEPTPLAPLLACIVTVAMAVALLQVSWASPIVEGSVLLVVAAALRNGVEKAQQTAAGEAQASPETLQEPSPPEGGQPGPPSRKPARAGQRFKGDHLWGLN